MEKLYLIYFFQVYYCVIQFGYFCWSYFLNDFNMFESLWSRVWHWQQYWSVYFPKRHVLQHQSQYDFHMVYQSISSSGFFYFLFLRLFYLWTQFSSPLILESYVIFHFVLVCGSECTEWLLNKLKLMAGHVPHVLWITSKGTIFMQT